MYSFIAKNKQSTVSLSEVRARLLKARIKPGEDYDWFVYTKKEPVVVHFRGKEVEITKGTKFGVRPSSNKKQIRMVMEDDINRVITLTLDQAKSLAKNSRAA